MTPPHRSEKPLEATTVTMNEPSREQIAAALVARLQAGDVRAEEEIVRRYGRGVTTILRRATNGRPEAEDLWQETFRVAIAKVRDGELREPERLPGFLASLARNLTIAHYRREARRRTEELDGEERAYASPDPSPLGQLLRDERGRLAREVIEELGTERDRELLRRFYVADEDKADICRDLGLSSLHFNRVLFRARQRFKALYLERVEARERAGPG